MNRSPLRMTLHPCESLSSYVSRFAGLYAAPDAATFVSWFGASFREVCRGTSRDLEKIAEVVNCEPGEMRKRVVMGKRTTRHFCDIELPKAFVRQFQQMVCPHCILDDEANGAGQLDIRPFARLTWAFAHHSVCPKHRRRLVCLPSHPWDLGDDFRLRLRMAKGKSHDFLWGGEDEEPTAIDRYLVGRFEDIDHQPSWLDDLSLPAALRLCEAFGHDHFPDSGFGHGQEPPFNGKINDGFNRIAASEDTFRNELRNVIARNYPKRSFNAFSVFADLTYEFIDDLHKPEFSKVANIMREVASEMLPLGLGDDLFGPIAERRFHTAKTAAREYEIPVSLLNSELRSDPTIYQDGQALPMLCDKRVFERIQRQLFDKGLGVGVGVSRFKDMIARERAGAQAAVTRPGDSLPMHIALGELKTTHHVAWSLGDEGYLAIFPAMKPKPHWRISKADIAEFRQRYISKTELRQLIRSKGQSAAEHDFTPIILRSDVGEDFFHRTEIMQAF
ncbi:TniQ family protein [Rhizobium giardinii]|uniref:TniQ family protein n=1 Tax=Rhizobium giardinii TaxID=56731 RepID=UPI003D6F46BC